MHLERTKLSMSEIQELWTTLTKLNIQNSDNLTVSSLMLDVNFQMSRPTYVSITVITQSLSYQTRFSMTYMRSRNTIG
ncbi:hypothetical protein GQ55_4G096100 [Panicum hallii var. hallii]|uniref:Uncharacterized protein n=1 Tax=Panicum hallii var. hallii TaxID=1504633 RepID=A0A2T7DWY5_9POAL|nr:hypothetical protein GQ55_4G096100 [Panicum hallii var. hallii]